MAWKFTDKILLKFQEALSIAKEKEDLFKLFDTLRLKLQRKSKDFSYALRADNQQIEIISKELFLQISICFKLYDLDNNDKLINISNKLFEKFIQAVHANNSERTTSIYNAKGIYDELCLEIELVLKSSKNKTELKCSVEDIAYPILKYLVKILQKLNDRSDEILKNYDIKTFEILLSALNPDRDLAAVRYIEIQEQLIRVLRINGSLIPEAHADEVFIRVSRRLLNGQELNQESPFGYFKQTAINVLQEYQRNVEKSLLSLDDTEFHYEPAVPENDEVLERQLANNRIKLETEIIKKCRAEHSMEENLLLDCYFFGKGSDQIYRRKMIGDLLKIDNNNLRIKIFRLKEKINKCIGNKLQSEKFLVKN